MFAVVSRLSDKGMIVPVGDSGAYVLTDAGRARVQGKPPRAAEVEYWCEPPRAAEVEYWSGGFHGVNCDCPRNA